ncbi:MAG: sigma-70 family RNA polymerase sigma factor [Flavobacteriales bacterium]
MEDLEAIRLASTGDHKAFGVLIGRYKHMVITVASRVMRNSMDAEEVTQDVFIKAYQKLGEFQGTGKFSTWLYSIAYRMSISALRSRKDQGSSLDDMKTAGIEPREAPLHPVDDRKQILEQALTTLEPEDAALVTMFYLEEMSVEEIVTVTQLSASNVKVKLHRSRKKLYDELHHQLKDELWTLRTNA